MAERLTVATEHRPRFLDRPMVGPFTARQLGLAATGVAVIAFLLLALTTPLARPPDTRLPQPGSDFFQIGEPIPGLALGQVAPELTGTHDGATVSLTDLDGRPIRLADLRGRPVWLNFWASWCPPCQEETPVLRDVYAQYRDRGVALVAVSVQESTVEDVRVYVDTYGLQYTVGFDATSAIFHTYHGFGLPTQFFIDGEGVIRNVVFGPVTRDEAAGYLDGLLD